MCSADVFLGLLALLFPPLPVWVKCGICSADSVINILLCFLGYVPGLLHAWYIIAKFPEPDYYDYERVGDSERAQGGGGRGGGRVTYVVVHEDGEQCPRRAQRPAQGQPKPPGRQANMSYGTNAVDQENEHHAAAAGSSSAPPQAPPPQGGYHHGGEGPSDGAAPPSYAQVLAGDNKVQDQTL